ncbi:MAG: ATP-binding protein [bacterium]
MERYRVRNAIYFKYIIIGVVCLTLYALQQTGLPLNYPSLYSIALLNLAFTGAYHIIFKRGIGPIKPLTYAYISFDILCITVAAIHTGGMESPLTYAYVLLIIVAVYIEAGGSISIAAGITLIYIWLILLHYGRPLKITSIPILSPIDIKSRYPTITSIIIELIVLYTALFSGFFISAEAKKRKELSLLSRRLLNLQKVTSQVQLHIDLDETLRSIVDAIHTGLGYEFALLGLVDEKREYIVPKAVAGSDWMNELVLLTGIDILSLRVPLSQKDNLLVKCIEDKTAYLTDEPRDLVKGLFSPRKIKDIEMAAIKYKNIADVKQILIIPLTLRDNGIGNVVVASKNRVHPQDIDVLMSISTHASIAIEKARLHRLVEYQVDDLKRAYSELTRVTEELEAKNRELEEANEKLSQVQSQLAQSARLAAIGEIGAGVAHEISNPLGVVLVYVQSIIERLKRRDLRDIDEYINLLRKVESATFRCNVIVRDLLKLSKPPKKRGPVNVTALIRDSINFLSYQIAMQRVDVEKHISNEDCYVLGDEGQIEQVFNNIFLNALQAMKESEVRKLAVRQNILEDSSDSGRRRKVRIVISDTGCGIKDENLKKIFNPFFTTKDEGVGLGLAISYQIIQDHGGTIEVSSEEGRGTSFTITLPLSGENG